jgi:malonate-semialdehyde dehydrogenase (acetylating)/methylmalonate-semialdehyde dehydrogenase
VQLVNGGRQMVNAILDHPEIKAVSFGSATARYISRASANGEAPVPGWGEESVVIMPDADMR